MEGIAEHPSLLTRFALAIVLAVLLPKAMERLRLAGVPGLNQFNVNGTTP